ncbi:MAG: hypothetical protein RBS80_27890 [Thermoguttaceae bacterium]|jgi:hypothetical protein|nr:hypothetical protein [Thermoguttaceae bacterium]
MLTEYALTPHLFDDEHNAGDGEWLERLRRFGARLLPRAPGGVCNTVVSNLCDGSWYAYAFDLIIQDLERRQRRDRSRSLPALDLLRSLRQPLKDRLVVRPFVPPADALPETEDEWAGEAETSAMRLDLPIHRLVGSGRLTAGTGRYRLDETHDEAFWKSIFSSPTIPADLDKQLAALRPFCCFYSFIAFSSPHLAAERSGGDLPFAMRLAKAALARHHDFQPPRRIDLHTAGTTDSAERRDQQAKAILERARAELGRGADIVRVFLWQTVKERRLLVGHANEDGNSLRATWGIAMTHVARPGIDDPKRDEHTFTLQDRSATSRLYSSLYGTTAPGLYPDSPWMDV